MESKEETLKTLRKALDKMMDPKHTGKKWREYFSEVQARIDDLEGVDVEDPIVRHFRLIEMV